MLHDSVFLFLNYHFKNIKTVKVIGFPKSLVNILVSRSTGNVALQTNETYCYNEVVSRCAFCIFWALCSVNHLSGPLTKHIFTGMSSKGHGL